MPIAVFIIGLAMLTAGVNDTQDKLSALVADDFTGEKSFTPWLTSIIIIGSLGVYKPIRPIADGLMGLVFLQMLLSSQGSIKQLGDAFKGLNIVPLDQYRKAKQ